MKTRKMLKWIGVLSALIVSIIVGMAFVRPMHAQAAIRLSKESIEVNVGKSKTLKLKGVSEKKSKKVRWSSSNPSVATVGLKTGKVKGISYGEAVITATLGSNTYECPVEVTDYITKVKISPKSVSVKAGESIQLSCNVSPVANHDTNIPVWTSSNTNVATVTDKGEVFGVKKGKATITVRIGYKEKKSSVVVNVKGKSSPRSIAKNYLTKNGSLSNGDVSVRYDGSSNAFVFKYIDNQYGKSLTMTVPNTSSPNVTWKFETSAATAQATRYASSYYSSTKLNYTVKKGKKDLGYDAIAQATTGLAMQKWNSLLYQNMSINLKDLGFTSY